MDENFKVFDFHRIFFGDAPVLFLLEIVFRTFIMYAYTVFLLRLLGKREMGQLSVLELAIIISFGSAVGDPMIGAEVPIVYGVIAITTVALLQIGLETFINKNKKAEALMEGEPNLVINDGVIDLTCLRKENLSKEDLLRALRSKSVNHLGEVNKAFVETNGQISVLFNAENNIKPGLSVMPENLVKETDIAKASKTIKETGDYCCVNCGTVKTFTKTGSISTCERCNCKEWIKATR